VLLVDDSIVRGTTSKEIVQMARDAGAAKVFFSSAAPPVRFPNVYGIDIPTKSELIANGREEGEIARLIDADWVAYQDLNDLKTAVQDINPALAGCTFEASVFDGKYVTGDIGEEYFAQQVLRKAGSSTKLPGGVTFLNSGGSSTGAGASACNVPAQPATASGFRSAGNCDSLYNKASATQSKQSPVDNLHQTLTNLQISASMVA
jgi:hypothetical protein